MTVSRARASAAIVALGYLALLLALPVAFIVFKTFGEGPRPR